MAINGQCLTQGRIRREFSTGTVDERFMEGLWGGVST